MRMSNWIISPRIGVKISFKEMKPPPRYISSLYLTRLTWDSVIIWWWWFFRVSNIRRKNKRSWLRTLGRILLTLLLLINPLKNLWWLDPPKGLLRRRLWIQTHQSSQSIWKTTQNVALVQIGVSGFPFWGEKIPSSCLAVKVFWGGVHSPSDLGRALLSYHRSLGILDLTHRLPTFEGTKNPPPWVVKPKPNWPRKMSITKKKPEVFSEPDGWRMLQMLQTWVPSGKLT